jgi:uncharacterized SAM-binding protein YcdF (DUF218 family)
VDRTPSRRLDFVRALLAPIVTALALATAAGFVLEAFRPGSAVHVHWLGAGGAPAVVALAFCATVLARRPLERRWGTRARRAGSIVSAVTAIWATAGTWAYERALAAGDFVERGSSPDACRLAAVLLAAWTVVGSRSSAAPKPARSPLFFAGAVAAAGCALVLAWIGAVGTVDYGALHDADAIVVFGSKVGADGRPSGSLLDRTVTACALWKRGATPVLFLSGGHGAGAPVSEPQAMRRIALAEGLPASALVLDEEGLTSAATVANVASLSRERGWRRVLAVSHDYHLARIRLLADRAGLSLRTSPARETCSSRWKLSATAREVVAFTAAWLYGARAIHYNSAPSCH